MYKPRTQRGGSAPGRRRQMTLGTQGANALYQVDQLGYSGTQVVYRFIIKSTEWSSWLNLMDNVSNGRYSDPDMNATVVRVDGTGVAARYTTGIRNRGAGTRAAHPHNMHLSIPRDNPLGSTTRLNFNTRTVHSQTAGNAIFSAAGLVNAYGTAVQVRINSSNLANSTPTGATDSYQFGSYYCFEAYDGDWAGAHFPRTAVATSTRAFGILMASSWCEGLSWTTWEPTSRFIDRPTAHGADGQ